MVARRDLFRQGIGAGTAVAIGVGGAALANNPQPTDARAADPRHLVLLVLDRSGSMSGRKADVIAGINSYLDQQVNNTGMYIGLVQFDSIKFKDGFCEPIFELTQAVLTPRLGPNDYQPRASTPLLAAFAESIGKLEQVIRPQDRAVVAVQTDGHENASPPEITIDVVRQLIAAKEANGNWTFVFLGADIDAWSTGGSLGLYQGNTMTYSNTATGTTGVYADLANGTNAWYTTTAGGMGAAYASTAPSSVRGFFSEADQQETHDSENTKTKENGNRSVKKENSTENQA